MSTRTMLAMSAQHDNRWAPFVGRRGVRDVSPMPRPDELRRIRVLASLDDELLRDLAPDLAIVRWDADALIFSAGQYLDVAFLIVDGAVEMRVDVGDPSSVPIFGARERTISLASEDFDLAAGERHRLVAGDVFGEIGALNGWPQSVTARTITGATLLQIRMPALRKLRRKSRDLRKHLDDVYRSRTLHQHLRSTPLLRACAAETIEWLASHVDLISCQPGDVVTRQGEAIDGLIIVRSGSLRLAQRVGAGELAVSYVAKGGTVGESELLVDAESTWEVSASSVGYSELVRIPKADFLTVLKTSPGLEPRLWQLAGDRIKEIAANRLDLARADLLDFSLEKGLTQANSVLVIDLDRCTRCDDCVRGCAATHDGLPRFVREGESYGGFLITRSCYHCQDPTCLVGCPTGAITRVNVGDTVAIDSSICIGCGSCAENCRYDSIVIHQLGTRWGDDALPAHLRGQPRAVASKCDLCRESADGPACVSSCPHGAALRVSGSEEFDALVQSKRRGRAS